VDLFCPATDALTTRRIADFPGGANDKPGGGHIKIVTSDSAAPHSGVFMLEGPLTRVDPVFEKMNGYSLATHGDSSGQLAPDVLYNIFTSPGHDGAPQHEHRPNSPPDLRVGDYIDSDGRDRQRVISVRDGGTRGSSIDNTILFVTTVRASDGAFASEGPAHLLLQDCGNTRLTRAGKPATPAAKRKRQPIPSVDSSADTKGPPPRYATLGIAQAAANLGLTSRESMKALLECAVGVSDEGITKLQTVAELRTKDSHWQGGATARPVPGERSAASREIDLTYTSGQRWLWDYSRRFVGCFGGFQYYVIFICRRSLFIRIYPVRDKSVATFITEALEPLRVFVATTHPGTFLQSIHGDSDSAVSQWGHGEHQDTLPLRAYNANLALPPTCTP
jgi:hypothetical protein